MTDIGNILIEIQRTAAYSDGLATVSAYLLEQLNNAVFPDDQTHDYTELL